MSRLADLLDGEWPSLSDTDRAIMIRAEIDQLLSDQQERIDELRGDLDGAESKIEDLEDELDEVRGQRDALQAKIDAAQDALRRDPAKVRVDLAKIAAAPVVR